MSQSVRVVARVIALPDKIEQLKAVLMELIEPTRAEVGCIQYDLLQNTCDPTDFTFVEEWTSTAALETHLTSPHLQKAINKINGLVAQKPDIRRYEHISCDS
ncbi:Antibiotic biosynthesis monooxygenase [Stanieria cyanosphaera PCC 7437]|uniref:Antibiotic biosynthesis monooxygenase n=1 Tax=Stanieria cyanosphaera (strain ATCC 29371 / PCC 7437) TaxID=111780 RepID=K9Y109_STAC7|nr:putative quinol monooxygenase [Stanieria cyanosphaera]AFZ37622.1 Antibiotic biosynthesis monooxygenase [Stanieria cyanosphaera PCC 7437]